MSTTENEIKRPRKVLEYYELLEVVGELADKGVITKKLSKNAMNAIAHYKWWDSIRKSERA